MLAAGHVPTYDIVDVSIQPATESTARALALHPGTPVMRVERIGAIDGRPATYLAMNFTTVAIGTDVDAIRALLTQDQSTTSLLADEFGITLERAATRADLRPIDRHRAERLDLVGRPMAWRTETVNRCAADRQPVEHTEAWLRADSFQVYMELAAPDGPSPFASHPPGRYQ